MPDAQGTFDVSLEWPLEPQYLVNIGPTATQKIVIGGFAFDLLLRPKPGIHYLITKLYLQAGPPFVAFGPDDHFDLMFGTATEAYIGAQTFFDPAKNLNAIYPVVGGFAGNTTARGGSYSGMKPLYISEKSAAGFVWDALPTSVAKLVMEYFELPSSQPLTSLFQF